MASVLPGSGVLPRTRPWTSLVHSDVQPRMCVGRAEGTDMVLGRRQPGTGSRQSPGGWRETLTTCVVQLRGRPSRRQCSQNTLPEASSAQPEPQRKKMAKFALRGRVSLDNRGPHKGSAGKCARIGPTPISTTPRDGSPQGTHNDSKYHSTPTLVLPRTLWGGRTRTMVVHQEPGATLFLEHVCRQSCPSDDFPSHWGA
jgi:hypothetical protein